MPAFELTPEGRSNRTLQLALFIASIAWILAAQALAARAARGISLVLNLGPERFLLSAIFFLFLLWLGFSVLQNISLGRVPARELLGLPKRASAGREWALGAAIGWGAMAVAVLPMALGGTLHVQFWVAPRAFELVLINLLTLAVAALAEEVAFRGFPFRRLIEAAGPTKATILMAIFFGMLHMLNPDANWTSTTVTVVAGVLLSIAWLRTRGLWLAWGLHFAWNVSMGVLFGLPVSGLENFSSVVQTRAIGRQWLTGGDYGPEAAVLTGLVLLVAIAVLVRVTRDYAWHYTYTPGIPGGYPLEAQPSAAHVAMEKQAQLTMERQAQQAQQAGSTSLVQILPAPPQSPPVEDETKQ